jgi:hypothetical protein
MVLGRAVSCPPTTATMADHAIRHNAGQRFRYACIKVSQKSGARLAASEWRSLPDGRFRPRRPYRTFEIAFPGAATAAKPGNAACPGKTAAACPPLPEMHQSGAGRHHRGDAR